MKRISLVVLFSMIFSSVLLAQGTYRKPGSLPGKQVEAESKIPNKWFKGARGYEEARVVQRETGADIVIYFSKMSPPDQKGLCRWWEKRGLQVGPVKRTLKEYIKVKLSLPGTSDDRELVKKFKLTSAPKLVVVQTNEFSKYVACFEWPFNKPQLRKPDDIAEDIRRGSGERYQVPEED